jgi:hypothetical protein
VKKALLNGGNGDAPCKASTPVPYVEMTPRFRPSHMPGFSLPSGNSSSRSPE